MKLFNKGPECCSNETISLHRTKDGHLLEYEYLIYHLTIDKRQQHQVESEKVRGRLLCCVTPTSSLETFRKRSALIRQTWGRRCDTLIFINGRTTTTINTTEKKLIKLIIYLIKQAMIRSMRCSICTRSI